MKHNSMTARTSRNPVQMQSSTDAARHAQQQVRSECSSVTASPVECEKHWLVSRPTHKNMKLLIAHWTRLIGILMRGHSRQGCAPDSLSELEGVNHRICNYLFNGERLTGILPVHGVMPAPCLHTR